MKNKSLNIKGKSLLTLEDVSDDELLCLLNLAAELKGKKKSGKQGHMLDGKHVVMIFEKASTRTRCAAAVAMADEGGRAEYISAGEIHLGKKESVADTARVLGLMFDGILFRGYRQETVEILAKTSGVPVWNGLTDEAHPTQALTDLLTVKEKFGGLKGVKLVYVGDGRTNVANSLMLGCAKTGIEFVNCTPREFAPRSDLVKRAEKIARRNDGSVSIVHELSQAVPGANVICTDVWVSMGEESKITERIKLLSPFQVNMELMEQTGNLANDNVIFLHCLPAFHDGHTELTKNTGALEVADDVFKASFSKVFDNAENRIHTMKAVMVATVR